MAIRRGRVAVRAPKRTMVWIGANGGISTIAAGTNTLIASLNAAALAVRPFTIVRTRIECALMSDQAAVTETPTGQFGIIVVSEQAIAIGATAIPNPTDDADGDWHVHQPVLNRFVFLSAVGVDQSIGGIVRTIDSKAMRRVGINKDLAFMFDMGVPVGGDFWFSGRFLVKLS